MKKGLSDATFIPTWDTEKFLKEAGKAGFEGVELNFREIGGDLTPDTTRTEARALAKKVEDFGLEIASMSTSLFNHYALSSGDVNLRKEGEEIALKMIELAGEMGTKVIQIVPGVITPDVPYEIAYNMAKESLERLAPEASANGVTIAIENVCNKFLPSPLEFVRFLDEINHSAVKAYFDNANAAVTGHPEHFVRLLGDRIVAVHLKDYREAVGDFVSILEGDINWPVIMNALREIPYKGYAIATPHYPYTYCLERCISTYSRNLDAVFNLSKPVKNH